MEHTPIPWIINKQTNAENEVELYIGHKTRKSIAKLNWGLRPSAGKREIANAEFIVRACNCHDELVAALEGCLSHFDSVLDEQVPEVLYIKAEQALERAKETT